MGTTTGVTLVATAGTLNVVIAVLSCGAETTTLRPHGTEMPGGRGLGIVRVLVGVQTLEELTTRLTPQGVVIPAGRA